MGAVELEVTGLNKSVLNSGTSETITSTIPLQRIGSALQHNRNFPKDHVDQRHRAREVVQRRERLRNDHAHWQ
jgi:hypothetical protein